jgi:thiol-disulfide isomerase/thioredoxin
MQRARFFPVIFALGAYVVPGSSPVDATSDVVSGPGLTDVASGSSRTWQPAAIAIEQFDARDLDGHHWTLERLRGRVVVIDFWATWCAPCLADLPRFKALRESYPRREFEIVGVMLDPLSRRSIVSWLNRNRIDWPQIHERGGYQGRLARAFGIDRLPASVLLDRRGAVVAVNVRGEQLVLRVNEMISGSAHPERGGR